MFAAQRFMPKGTSRIRPSFCHLALIHDWMSAGYSCERRRTKRLLPVLDKRKAGRNLGRTPSLPRRGSGVTAWCNGGPVPSPASLPILARRDKRFLSVRRRHRTKIVVSGSVSGVCCPARVSPSWVLIRSGLSQRGVSEGTCADR